MNPGPQKPRISRPPALSRPEALVAAVARPIAEMAPASKVGLWVSLGLHACLIAAACSVTFISSEEKGKGKDETSGDRADFEMAISSREPQTMEPNLPATSTPLPAPQQLPLAILNNLTALRDLPAFEPIAAVTAGQPSAPVAASTVGGSTERSSSPSSTQATKVGGKKGSGTGKRAKQTASTAPPRLVSAPPPRYPIAARAAKKTGKVGILIRVRANGSAASTSVYHTSGNSSLDQAAVTAAQSWKFSQTPTLDPGATIAVVVQVTFAL